MIGILLLSHGELANGMLDSVKLFFGDDIPSIHAECLGPSDSPESFDIRIKDSIEKLDDGHGVVILCDLFGGTPNNRCAMILNDRIRVISGVNFGLLIELLGLRMQIEDVSEVDVSDLIETGRMGMVDLNEMMTSAVLNNDDDDDD